MAKEISVKKKLAVQPSAAPQRGFEAGVTQEDLIIPRAKLMQAMSPELAQGLEGVKVGSIINSLTKEPLPQEFIPVFMFKNFIRFNPRSKDDPNYDPDFEPGAVIWRSGDMDDAKIAEAARFGPNGEKPVATAFLNFFSYFPGVPMPVIVSFSKTGYKTGKQLLSLARFCGGDMFSRKYRLYSQSESNSAATFCVLKVSAAGASSPEEYKLCEGLWRDFAAKAKDIQVHDEDAAEEAQDSRPY